MSSPAVVYQNLTVMRIRLMPFRPRNIRVVAKKLFLLVPLILVACSGVGPYQIYLMPAPRIYSETKIDPFSDESSKLPIPYEGILYATDRLPAKTSNTPHFYEDERGHVLRLGIGTIQLGQAILSREEAKKISLLADRGQDYPLVVKDAKELGILESSRSRLFEDEETRLEKSADGEFAGLINRKLAVSSTKDVYLYIHGYKVVFSDPLLVSTELWHFLGYDGVFIAYAWPSTPSRWAYAKDLETAAYTSRNLRLLLEYLAARTDARRIHLIAYSAGTRVVIDALGQLALMNARDSRQALARKLRIGHVILVGSDSDRDIFAGLLEDGLLKVMQRFTIYMSDTDRALSVSNFLFVRRRLGQVFNAGMMEPAVREYLERTKNLIAIDVTNAEDASVGNGHAYFRHSPWVSSDLLMTLKYDLAPEERGLEPQPTLPIWKFPDDYTERLRQQLKSKIGLD